MQTGSREDVWIEKTSVVARFVSAMVDELEPFAGAAARPITEWTIGSGGRHDEAGAPKKRARSWAENRHSLNAWTLPVRFLEEALGRDSFGFGLVGET